MRRERDPAVAFDEFVELWQKFLAEAKVPGTTVVVEGERDRRAIRRLGWSAAVVVVHRGRSLSATAQSLVEESRRVIVLTDWDTAGGTFARRFREFLTAERVELDLDYRRRLAHILRGELAHVEGLYGWARRNADRFGIPIEQVVGSTEPDGPARPTG
ncbi:MAG: toprim domain-containing protein [Thermoplasmata archaeon]